MDRVFEGVWGYRMAREILVQCLGAGPPGRLRTPAPRNNAEFSSANSRYHDRAPVAAHPSRRPAVSPPAHKKRPPRISRRSLMEAQGIEPWSESASRTASTCVGRISCRHSGPVTSRPARSLSPRFSPRAPEPHAGPARICDSGPTPQAGFGTEGA